MQACKKVDSTVGMQQRSAATNASLGNASQTAEQGAVREVVESFLDAEDLTALVRAGYHAVCCQGPIGALRYKVLVFKSSSQLVE